MKSKVLIIEDEELMLRFLEQRLKNEDFEVDIARDGNEAMQHIRQNKYATILTDLMLPFVSGFELIAKIRADERNNDTPVLVLSALSTANTIVDALKIGANDFLKKPFAINVLLTKIKLLLSDGAMLKAVS
ncbi:MAG: response regulator [Chitinophagaceae bacterium]|nr:MAG: response regulator [Chitinophagaceae bacterium]